MAPNQDPSRLPGEKLAPRIDPGYARHAALGLQFAATIGVLALAGHWADRALGSHPWLLIAGVFIGLLGATLSLVRKIPLSRPRRPPSPPSAP